MNLRTLNTDPRRREAWAGAAVSAQNTRGRQHKEPGPGYRSEFQRDRDRIIHSASFRRLEYKTQVFVSHEGDMFRTRLTHSIEVAQIARTVARALGLNEDLTEGIALGHDLGHSPFGHAGQSALNRCMRDYGGFEHNLQSLRVVDELENRYPDFAGLNLLFETREGLLKHCSQHNAARLGSLGERFLRGEQPTAEAQICDLADAIAYNHHDIDDGIRSGLLAIDALTVLEPFAESLASFEIEYGASMAAADDSRARTLKRHFVVRRMINLFVSDLIATASEHLEALAPAHPDAVRAHGEAVVRMSASAWTQHLEIKRFLMQNLYRHPRVTARMQGAEEILETLFAHYMANPQAAFDKVPTDAALPRAVCDHIAGMTDRFAIGEYQRVTGDQHPEFPGVGTAPGEEAGA